MDKEDRLNKIGEAVCAAREIQEFLWGHANSSWGLEEWRRMFRKRIKKIEDIDPANPHAMVELKKRLLQNAALCIGLLEVISNIGVPEEGVGERESNLHQYSEACK
jgi:hypothetical protein